MPIRRLFHKVLGFFQTADTQHVAAETSTPPVATPIRRDDRQLREARERAIETLPEFLALLDDPPMADAEFYLKAMFRQDGAGERLWIANVQRRGNEFVGEVSNDPQIVKRLRFGDSVEVRVEDVHDWMVTAGERTYGGHSLELTSRRQD
ncbi:MAG: DUF2314 domain-containing protein [Planctomycetales bacterium]|nr:DUF2314 domain-containing protein [Planctomycetales bacterium]